MSKVNIKSQKFVRLELDKFRVEYKKNYFSRFITFSKITNSTSDILVLLYS